MSNESVTIPGLGLVYTPITPSQVPKTILAPAYIGLDMFNRGDKVYNCDSISNKVHDASAGPYTVVTDHRGDKKLVNPNFQIVDHHGCPYTLAINTEMSITAGGISARVRKAIPNPAYTEEILYCKSQLKGGDVFTIKGMNVIGFITEYEEDVVWWYPSAHMAPRVLSRTDMSWGINANDPVLIKIGTLKTYPHT